MIKFARIHFNRYFSKLVHKSTDNMNIAYLKLSKPDDDQLHITFHYSNELYKVNRVFNFSRSINEKIGIASERIRGNLDKFFSKQGKQKKNKNVENFKQTPEITVKFLTDDEDVSERTFSELIEDIMVKKNVILRILDDSYYIKYNQPWVKFLTLSTSILAGFYIYPEKFEVEFTNKTECNFEWFHGVMPASKNEKDIIWKSVGKNYIYLVQNSDIGHHLKIVCTPFRDEESGLTAEYISICSVQAGPGICPFDFRHLYTEKKLEGKQFRVTTYNLLADYYADSDYSRKELFPYCPTYALDIDYRKQLFIKELAGYQSDIMCLQEVDSKIFLFDLEPFFAEKSYSGYYKKKGTTAEGLATFYDNQRFDLVETQGINIGENVKSLEIFRELWEKIRYNKKLEMRVIERSTAVQVTTLKSKELNKFLVVANTHLYFHPNADHVRLLQIGFCMLYLQNIYDKTKEKYNLNDNNISIIFCGDFNSVPECGIYKLLTQNYVGDDFIDWNSCEEEIVKNITLEQNFKMESACGCPMYTNYTPSFKECLDYIFYQTDFISIIDFIPLPSEAEMSAHTAIPSVTFPSDHIALCANLEWK